MVSVFPPYPNQSGLDSARDSAGHADPVEAIEIFKA